MAAEADGGDLEPGLAEGAAGQERGLRAAGVHGGGAHTADGNAGADAAEEPPTGNTTYCCVLLQLRNCQSSPRVLPTPRARSICWFTRNSTWLSAKRMLMPPQSLVPWFTAPWVSSEPMG